MKRRNFVKGGAAIGLASFSNGIGMAGTKTKLHVPPEEDRHELTFMQWPVNRGVHPDRIFLGMLQQTIANIANSIAEFEPVILLAAKEDHAKARKLLGSNVELWDIPTEDLWCRDSDPLFAKQENGKLAVSHLEFNGWGGRQIDKKDGEIAKRVAERLSIPIIASGLKGEAGGAEHDGHGLLMAHESSWVNKNRNPNLSRKEIEVHLLKAYGATRMIWSKGVYDEDITDYHIDSLARFTAAGRVLINLPDNPDMRDPFHKAAFETHDALIADGLDVEVILEPNKRRVKSYDFVASYANYYACNGAIIAAQFGDAEADTTATEALKKHYKGREIITLNVDTLGEVGGGIHCATQQMPAT